MGIRVVLTPAGPCPYKLTATDRDSVVEWANAVLESGMRQNLKYTPEALAYWVWQFYDYGSPEHKLVRQILTDEFGVTPAAILNAEYGKKPKKEEKREEIADIDSFAVYEEEEEEEEDIVVVKKKKKND